MSPRLVGTDAGSALVVVLLLLLTVSGSSASSIWLMNQQQTRAGHRARSAAALALAEAGVHRALAILEATAPDGSMPGRTWRPAAYSEPLAEGPRQGQFILSLADDSDGAVIVTSTGQVGDTSRRLRVRISLASPALLAALYGAGVVRFEQPPAATVILPYGAGIGDRPWVHVAAGQEVWFATTDISINDPSVAFDAASGPADVPESAEGATRPHRPGPVRILLSGGAELTLQRNRQRVDIQQLRAMGVYVDGIVLRAATLPAAPLVDRAFYQALAAGNTANAKLNLAAGKYLGNIDLARKRDSLYSSAEFRELQEYLAADLHQPRLQGIVYIKGALVLDDGRRLQIAEGSLIVEDAVYLRQGASLEITHSAATRRLPGLILLDRGALILTERARLRAHGLVYSSRFVGVDAGARMDVVGAVLANDPGLSFRNLAGTVIIRYDPAVLGTPGLRVPAGAPVVAWPMVWEEQP